MKFGKYLEKQVCVFVCVKGEEACAHTCSRVGCRASVAEYNCAVGRLQCMTGNQPVTHCLPHTVCFTHLHS